MPSKTTKLCLSVNFADVDDNIEGGSVDMKSWTWKFMDKPQQYYHYSVNQ